MRGRSHIDMAGQRFGRWTVLRTTAKVDGDTHTQWICECECGTVKRVNGGSLRRGQSKSCGCMAAELTAKRNDGLRHGMSGTPEHRAWVDMKSRCSNGNDSRYQSYGGRGIAICERWSSFENFYADMGKRPSCNHSLDRIDNDGNYEPRNCRWATRGQQQANRRNTLTVTAAGINLPMSEWSRVVGVSYSALTYRRSAGWPDDEIIFGRGLVDMERLMPIITADMSRKKETK